MKRIIIDDAHREEIAAVLEEVQHRCTARTLTAQRIIDICERVTEKANIPKSALKGSLLCYDGAEKFPSAYRFRPESTHFRAEYDGRAWRLISIIRDTCPNRSTSNIYIAYSDSAKKALLDRFAEYNV